MNRQCPIAIVLAISHYHYRKNRFIGCLTIFATVNNTINIFLLLTISYCYLYHLNKILRCVRCLLLNKVKMHTVIQCSLSASFLLVGIYVLEGHSQRIWQWQKVFLRWENPSPLRELFATADCSRKHMNPNS